MPGPGNMKAAIQKLILKYFWIFGSRLSYIPAVKCKIAWAGKHESQSRDPKIYIAAVVFPGDREKKIKCRQIPAIIRSPQGSLPRTDLFVCVCVCV